MKFQWFVLHTLAGQEQKVRDTINRRIKTDEMESHIKEVLLPMEKVVEVRGGKKTVTNRKLHPGYVYVEMALLDDGGRPMEKPWYFAKDIQGVIGFVGGGRPVEVTADEIAVIRSPVVRIRRGLRSALMLAKMSKSMMDRLSALLESSKKWNPNGAN